MRLRQRTNGLQRLRQTFILKLTPIHPNSSCDSHDANSVSHVSNLSFRRDAFHYSVERLFRLHEDTLKHHYVFYLISYCKAGIA